MKLRTRRSIACIASLALAGSLALAVPQVAGAAGCTQRRAKVTVDKASKAIQPGGTAYFTLKVKNMDSRGCAATRFLMQSGAYQDQVMYMVMPGNDVWATLGPQQTGWFTIQAKAAAGSAPGVYKGGVSAYEWENMPWHGGKADIQTVIR